MKPAFAALGAGMLALAMASPAAAVPVTIDFEGFEPGDVISGPGVFAGVTFSSDTDLIVSTDVPPPDLGGERVAAGFLFEHAAPVRADFATATTFVSVALGDFNADEETLFLRAFDAADNLLTSQEFVLAAVTEGGPTLSVSAAGIAYVLFGSTGEFPNSIYFDNFTFEVAETSEVPEPASLALIAAGLGALGLARRRRLRPRAPR